MSVETLWGTLVPQSKPILKWAGGKQQMLDVLLKRAPHLSSCERYIEPFFGGGALFFALQPIRALIADSNPELINLYSVVASNVESVIEHLRGMKTDECTFYKVRSQDYEHLSPAERAARTIFLNRTCFNGLYRVNRRGQFNVPYGRYTNPTICDEDSLRAASLALQGAKIVLGDYKEVLRKYAAPGDFVYLDPPYLPVSAYSDFKRYTKEQFYERDHHELAVEVHRLHDLGCYVVLTNSNHPLVRSLYADYSIEVFPTRRNINKVASRRIGEDIVVTAVPKRRLRILPNVTLPKQVNHFPATRFMGSKQNLTSQIWAAASQFEFESVLDLFSGSGAVGYMFKAHGKQVISNDYMRFSSIFAEAMIENNTVTLTQADVALLCDPSTVGDRFVQKTFRGLYYSDEDNAFIDTVRANLPHLRSKAKRSLAMAALARACMKKRPRGIFTFIGHRYDDGRRDLRLTLHEQFLEAVAQVNGAVFDNGKRNRAVWNDALLIRSRADLVYIDPPYFSPLSDNEYVRRYHFVEGLARDWKGVELQAHTKTMKFKSYPTPFSTLAGAQTAFDALFRQHSRSIIVVSYSSNSLPSLDEMVHALSKHKKHVEIAQVDHRYSFGNQGHIAGNQNNRVKEYLFIGY